MYLGDYIVINCQTGPFEFLCESVSTGTPFTARIDEDKRDLFREDSFLKEHPNACRFLRPDGNLLRCTIHHDSPAQCKFYRCVLMKIYNRSGTLIGTVTGTYNLHSENAALREIWDRETKGVPESRLEHETAKILQQKGYLVE